jgi:glycerol-3-phosphate acyltransferase PlsY
MTFVVLIIAAYLLGSAPFGVIIAKAHGKDLRTIGSGNIGATNVSRALGKKWAYFCFLLDVLKGLVPTLLAVLLISFPPNITELLLVLAVGVAAILGHIFPVYLKFKNGNTSSRSISNSKTAKASPPASASLSACGHFTQSAHWLPLLYGWSSF